MNAFMVVDKTVADRQFTDATLAGAISAACINMDSWSIELHGQEIINSEGYAFLVRCHSQAGFGFVVPA